MHNEYIGINQAIEKRIIERDKGEAIPSRRERPEGWRYLKVWEKKSENDVTRRLESEEDVRPYMEAWENINIFYFIVIPINVLRLSFSFFFSIFHFFKKPEVPMNLTICPDKKRTLKVNQMHILIRLRQGFIYLFIYLS